MTFENYNIGFNNSCFIVAELSANHVQDFNIAIKTIEAMAQSGADAVKLQTYKPSSLSLNVDNYYYGPKEKGLWQGYRPWDLYTKAATPYEWQEDLKVKAEELGMLCFSSPFDFEGVDLMEELKMPIYKIASLEINDIPLIEYVASKGKPIILSTGAATLGDIELAVNTCKKCGNNEIAVLQCSSQYPTPVEKANLKRLPHLQQTFYAIPGLSDHTPGSVVPIASVSLGAKIIEKHFILDRSLDSPDANFSMEPSEFQEMVDAVRFAEKAMGQLDYTLPEEDRLRRRSLFAVQDIEAGEAFTKSNIRSVRPGHGLHPKHYYDLLDKKANVFIEKGTPLNWEMIVS